MSVLLYRIGRWCVCHRRQVVAAWLLALVGIVALGMTAGGDASEDITLPGSETQEAVDLLEESFPNEVTSTARVVFTTEDGSQLDEPASTEAITAMLDEVAGQPDVVEVVDPFAADAVSPEGTIAYADVVYGTSANEVPSEAPDALDASAAVAENAGLQVELGGEAYTGSDEEGNTSEMVGLAAAVVVLLIAFGSVVAMGLPIATALVGVGISIMGLSLTSAVFDMPDTGEALVMMIGMAVGIDYALFIVTRHRQNLAEGYDVTESIARAIGTAGTAVTFAGLTTVVALSGLAVIGIPFLTATGLAPAGAVLVAVVIAITLLPALLGFAGRNIDRLRVGRARTGSAAEAHRTLSARWARRVTARPGLSLAAGLGFMLLLSVPMLSMRPGLPDDGAAPPSTTERQAYDLLAEGFGPGFNGPLSVVVDLSEVSAGTDAALDEIAASVEADSDVLAVGEPTMNEAGDTAVLTAFPRTGPASETTEDLVHRLRDDTMRDVEAATGAEVMVSGGTAGEIDFSNRLADVMPFFIAVVIALSAALVLVAFRSIVVPIKAAIGVLLSISASIGVVVAIFQWGWLKDLFGLEETLPIASYMPMFMFALLFGLSMDYEMFILSRIREDYIRTGDTRRSVVSGLTSSARVITAAALIMISVFSSFLLDPDPTTKMMAIGFSMAVLLDATVVRMVIVPSTMALFDRANWWLPSWLDRLLPHVDIEGERLAEQLDQPADVPGHGDTGRADSPPVGTDPDEIDRDAVRL